MSSGAKVHFGHLDETKDEIGGGEVEKLEQ
jgi:hypothetical protein